MEISEPSKYSSLVTFRLVQRSLPYVTPQFAISCDDPVHKLCTQLHYAAIVSECNADREKVLTALIFIDLIRIRFCIIY